MQRFLNVLTHPRTLTIVGFAALAAVLFIAADALQIGLVWAAVALGVALALWLATKLWRRWRVRRANRQLGDMLEQQAETGKMSAAVAEPAKRAELDVLRTRLADTVKTIKTSKSARCRAAPRCTNCRGTS